MCMKKQNCLACYQEAKKIFETCLRKNVMIIKYKNFWTAVHYKIYSIASEAFCSALAEVLILENPVVAFSVDLVSLFLLCHLLFVLFQLPLVPFPSSVALFLQKCLHSLVSRGRCQGML